MIATPAVDEHQGWITTSFPLIIKTWSISFCVRHELLLAMHSSILAVQDGNDSTLTTGDLTWHVLPTTNGLRYRRLGRDSSRNGKLQSSEPTPKNAQSPSRPMHALLGAHCSSRVNA